MGVLSLLLASLPVAFSNQFFHLADLRIEPYYDSNNLVDHVCRSARCVSNPNDPSCVMFKVGSAPFDALGRPGCDGPIGLLDSMLAHMKTVNANPQFILTSGDLTANGLTVDKGHLVQDQVLRRIRNAFPSTPIIPCVGNHDMFPKNSLSTSEFTRLYNLFALHTAIPNDSDSVSKFSSGGYFTWTDTVNKLRVLMLNTGLFSPKSAPDSLDPKWKAVAEEQFLWIKEQLAIARTVGDKVILSGHIPPGRYTIDGDGWFTDEAERFKTLVESYSDVVMIQLFSHFSTELIRSYSPTFGQLVAQGMSPRFSQVASYQHLQTNNNVVVNASAFGLDLATATTGKANWRHLYSLPDMYQVADVSAASIAATVSKIVNMTDFGGEYVRFQFPLEADVLMAPTNITSQLLCETVSMTEIATQQCMSQISSKSCSGFPSAPPSPCPTCSTCPTCPVVAPTACPSPAKCPDCPVFAPTPSLCPQCPPQTPPPSSHYTPCPSPEPCPAPTPAEPCPTPTPAEPCKTIPPSMPCPTPDTNIPVCGVTETVCTETLQRTMNCIVGKCISTCSMCAISPTTDNRAAAQVADAPGGVSPTAALIAALVVAGAAAMGGIGSALYFKSQCELLRKQMEYAPVRATMYNPINE